MVGEIRQDLFRTRLLLGSRGRMTDENPLARSRVTRPLHVERTGDSNAAYAFEVRQHVIAAYPVDDAFLDERVFQECRGKLSCSGLHRHADLQVRIGRGSAAEHDLLGVGGNGEQLEPLIVEPEIDLAFTREAQILVVSVPAKATEISYSPSTGNRWRTMVPPREPTGAVSPRRSS